MYPCNTCNAPQCQPQCQPQCPYPYPRRRFRRRPMDPCTVARYIALALALTAIVLTLCSLFLEKYFHDSDDSRIAGSPNAAPEPQAEAVSSSGFKIRLWAVLAILSIPVAIAGVWKAMERSAAGAMFFFVAALLLILSVLVRVYKDWEWQLGWDTFTVAMGLLLLAAICLITAAIVMECMCKRRPRLYRPRYRPRIYQCRPQCQPQCRSPCRVQCQPQCQSPCQVQCQPQCQSPCQAQCQSPCQVQCQPQCQTQCQAQCQSPCQVQCQPQCQTQCQSPCQAQCQSPCQPQCQSPCQPRLYQPRPCSPRPCSPRPCSPRQYSASPWSPIAMSPRGEGQINWSSQLGSGDFAAYNDIHHRHFHHHKHIRDGYYSEGSVFSL